MCLSGPTEPSCGGMTYHGDSTLHHLGKTTEAITIEEIGQVDYLFYLNREIPADLASSLVMNELRYRNEDGLAPVLKYYIHELLINTNHISYQIIHKLLF